MCLDGVYTFHEWKPHFHSITPPTQDEIDWRGPLKDLQNLVSLVCLRV